LLMDEGKNNEKEANLESAVIEEKLTQANG
jgi:hypothetical protein